MTARIRRRAGAAHVGLRAVVALSTGAMLSAGARAADAATPFTKPDWKVAAVSCPIGCSDATRKFLQTQVGGTVRLSPTRFAAPWDDPCEGALRYDARFVPSTAVVAEVNRGVASSHRQMMPADLKLDPLAATTTAVALCRGAKGEAMQQRLLVIEKDRILVLFEEQSIIELR